MAEFMHATGGPAKACTPGRMRAALVFAAILCLAGCGEPQAPLEATDAARPALIHEVRSSAAGGKLRFPGRIRAERRAELSFDVPGFVAEFVPIAGSHVQAGQVVARLDDAVFRARVTAAGAEFDRAKADLERYQRLWETERAVAPSEVDERRSRLEVARTNLATADRELADTVIRAPFAGVITRRRLETFSNVQAKQPIADLQDLDALEVVINVPARVVRTATEQQAAEAIFEGEDARTIPLKLKSFATDADPQTQTYEIVLSLGALPPGINVFPGMSVTVLPFAGAVDEPGDTVSIPLTAVATDASGATFVWVVDAQSRAERREVRTGAIRGGDITIATGLVAGERIIAAGVSAVRAGMLVRPLSSTGADPA